MFDTFIQNIIIYILIGLICLCVILAAVFKVLAIYENKKNADKLYIIIKKDGKVIKRKYMTDDEYNAKLSEIASYTGFHQYEMINFDLYEGHWEKIR
ncbi:MAG: hypothetical protein K2K57_15015 [Oscillospiraceae bacterium]|nr:hypothetical protein [Oscillospiraceae bacterium]